MGWIRKSLLSAAEPIFPLIFSSNTPTGYWKKIELDNESLFLKFDPRDETKQDDFSKNVS